MKKVFNRALVFAIALALTSALMLPDKMHIKAAEANPAANNSKSEWKINFQWNPYNQQKGYYNPDDKNKDISFKIAIGFKGNDSEGKLQQGKYYIYNYSGKIGTNTTLTVDTSKLTDAKDKKQYTNCDITSVYPFPYKDNYIYGASSNVKADRTSDVVFDQNMNTKVTASKEQGAIVIDAEIPIKFTALKGTEALTTNAGEPVAGVMKFKEGDMHTWKTKDIKEAVWQNTLGSIFNPYNEKQKDFKFQAAFTGEREQELNKRYELEFTGDKLQGWTLKLKSKIKKGNETKTEDVAYKTEYIYDANLLAGTKEVRQAGQLGTIQVETPYYYLEKQDGTKELLKTADDEAVTKVIKSPVTEIIAYGPDEIEYVPSVETKPTSIPTTAAKMQVAKTGEIASTVSSLGLVTLLVVGAYLAKKH